MKQGSEGAVSVKSVREVKCENCNAFVYKGDDECYCRRVGYKEFRIASRWQKHPKWCPIVAQLKREKEAQAAQKPV